MSEIELLLYVSPKSVLVLTLSLFKSGAKG